MGDEWKLAPCAGIAPHPGKPVLVCILDGFGENEVKDQYNAVHSGKTPVVDRLRGVAGRWRTVKAHGPAVGLPTWDDMGNSEVGHNALGAGQLIDQARARETAIRTGAKREVTRLSRRCPMPPSSLRTQWRGRRARRRS